MFGVAFTVFNFLSIFFLLLPSAWHYRARNTATLLYIFWCLVNVIPLAFNSAIWYNRYDLTAPVYCDIVTKLRVGGEVGIAASVLCLTRQLESIAAARQAYFNAKDRRRRRMEELALGLGFPILIMILHTVVQGHRYDIYERVGCVVSVYWSLPLILLVQIWPIIFLLASCVYAVLAVRLFLARRKQFASVLESSKSAISTSRFIRLIALSGLQAAYTLPILLFVRIYSLVHQPLLPYVSWEFVHEDFGWVGKYSNAYLDKYTPEVTAQVLELGYWLYPVSSALFFVFFGLGAESIAAYKDWARAIRSCFRRSKSPTHTDSSASLFSTEISLPAYPRSEHSLSPADDLEKNGGDAAVPGIFVTVERQDFSSV
ncbi:hypothetical protein JCM10212_001590 [Sporobolomyces blumeae]